MSFSFQITLHSSKCNFGDCLFSHKYQRAGLFGHLGLSSTQVVELSLDSPHLLFNNTPCESFILFCSGIYLSANFIGWQMVLHRILMLDFGFSVFMSVKVSCCSNHMAPLELLYSLSLFPSFGCCFIIFVESGAF